ncbi:MAG: hypothetical protein WA906_09605 [Pacificimonas sp.]
MRMLSLAVAVGLGACATVPDTDRKLADPIALLAGTWQVIDNDGRVSVPCANGQHFAPAPDGQWIELTELGVQDFKATYEVITVSGDDLLLKIVDETRLTPAGKPVQWSPVFLSDNEFRWHRADWNRASMMTRARWVRC